MPSNGSPIPPNDENFKIFLAFNEDLDSGTVNNSNIYLSDGTSTFLSTITYSNSLTGRPSYYPQDDYLVIVSPPSGGFTEKTNIMLVYTDDVRDVAGNPLNNGSLSYVVNSDFSLTSDWGNFGTGAMMPPDAYVTYPSDGSDSVPTNAKIYISFTEPIDLTSALTSGNAKLYSVNTSTGVETLVTTTASLNSSNDVLTLTPSTSLSAGSYHVVVTGALQSANGIYLGNPSAGQNTQSYIYRDSFFKVKSTAGSDSAAPTILGTWPTSGQTEISTSPGSISIQVSEAADPNTVNSNVIFLKKGGSTSVEAYLDYDPYTKTIFLTPQNLLSTNTSYTIQVTGGASGLKDAVGNPLATTYTSNFTTSATGDTTPPAIMYANGDEFAIAITFNEQMNHAEQTDTVNYPTSVLNPANYIIKYGDPLTVSVTGTPIELGSAGSATFTYNEMEKTVHIENLGLNYSTVTGNDYYIIMTQGTVSGSGAADFAENKIAGNTTFQMPIQSSAETDGFLGPMMAGGPVKGPDMGNMGMMMSGVFPMNGMAGQNTVYFVDIPVTQAMTNGSKITITFPQGFDISGAKKDPNSPLNNDINEWNGGTITFGSAVEASGGASNDGVTVDTASSTITITLAVTTDENGESPPSDDYLHLDLANIVNTTVPRGPETEGYRADIKTYNSSNKLLESVNTMPFFIFEGGSSSLTGSINGINATDVDGLGDEVCVYLGSPMTGPMESCASVADNGTASYSFTQIPAGNYMLFTDPDYTLDGHIYYGKPMPEPIYIDGADTKNITLQAENSGAVATVTVNITGAFGTDDIDVFASSPSGFRKKTLTSAGTNPSTTLYLPDGEWSIGIGPAMPDGPMSGPPPMPDWMPPMNVNIKVMNSGASVQENSGTTSNDGVIALSVSSANLRVYLTVKDGSGVGIPDVEVFAYQPNGGNGSFTTTTVNGLAALKIADLGTYSVGVHKNGLPSSNDKTIELKANTTAVDGNTTADVYYKNVLITETNPLIFTIQKPPYTISGKVTDGTNSISYVPVWVDNPNGGGHIETMTDSSGNYILYVYNGTWNLQAYIPDYVSGTYAVTMNGSNVTQNISPDSSITTYTISGSVSIGGTAQSYMPIRAVKMDAYGNFLGQYDSSTDESGNYTITAPAGIYRVDIWTPDYGEVERTDADDYLNNPANLNLTANKAGVNISVDAANLRTVTILFTNGKTSQYGFVDINGIDMTDTNNPKPTGFHKSIYVPDLSEIDTTVQLRDGDYQFFLNVPNLGMYIPIATDLHETKGDIVVSGNRNVTFELLDASDTSAVKTITGTVSSSETTPIEDAWVWITRPSTGYHNGTQTASDGTYSLTIPTVNGTYMIGVDKPGYLSDEPAPVLLVDADLNGTVDIPYNFTLTPSDYTISGYLYDDSSTGGTANTRDSGEEMPNGWVRAKEINTGYITHASVDGTGFYSLDVTDGTWKVFGMADGYKETQYSIAGVSALLTVTTADLESKDIELQAITNYSNANKKSQVTPANGGTVDDTGETGTKVKLTIPPNALGSSSSAGSVSVNSVTSVSKTKSTNPLLGTGKQVNATDSSSQPITNLDDYVDIEMIVYKSDIDDLVANGDLVEMAKLWAMQISYFDSSVNDWVTLSTTRDAYYKTADTDTEWTLYQATTYDTGYEQFIYDALINETFTTFADYKLAFKASTNHFTVFGVTVPTDGSAPSTPASLSQTSGSGTSVVLDWADNSEADLLEYEIYRSTSTGVNKLSTQVNSSSVTTSTFTDSSTTAWTSYYYTVTAADDSGNESAIATELRVCSTKTVTNGTVSSSCTVTCNTGYTPSGNSCVASGDTGGGGVTLGGSSGSSNSASDQTSEEGEADAEEAAAEELAVSTVADTVYTEAYEVVDGIVAENMSLMAEGEIAAATFEADTTITTADGEIYTGEISPPTVVEGDITQPKGFIVLGSVYEVGAVDVELNFDKSVTLRFPLPESTSANDDVSVYYFNETTGEWTEVGGEIKQLEDGSLVIEVLVDHFTKFAVMEEEAKVVEEAIFEDTVDHWAKEFIEDLYNQGIVSGYDETHYGPDNNISRAEFTKIAIEAFSIPTLDPSEVTFMPFKDVDTDEWYAAFVQAAYVWDIVTGYKDGTFKPNQSINRAEAMRILFDAAKIDVDTSYDAGFEDVDSAEWYAPYINYAAEQGIVSGYEDGTFGPSNNLKRGEVAKIVSLLLKTYIENAEGVVGMVLNMAM